MEVPATRSSRTHFWYAVVADCYLEEYDARPPQVHFDVFFYNGDSHLPADETGLPTIYTLVLIATVGFLYFVLNVMRGQYKKVGQVHLIVLLLAIAIVLQTCSHLMELTHLNIYMSNGKGLRWRHTYLAFDVLAQIALGLSELVIQFLLITLAFGWTLVDAQSRDVKHTPMLGPIGKALSTGSAIKFRLGFFGSTAFAQINLMIMGRKYEDDFNQFHDFEHWPGHALMATRVCLCVLFLLGGYGTLKSDFDAKVKEFEKRLLAIGTVWFLAFPLLVVFLAPFLEPYNRHPAVTGGSIILQSVALALLSTLFLTESNYLKMSTLATMGTMFGPKATTKKWFKVAVD